MLLIRCFVLCQMIVDAGITSTGANRDADIRSPIRITAHAPVAHHGWSNHMDALFPHVVPVTGGKTAANRT